MGVGGIFLLGGVGCGVVRGVDEGKRGGLEVSEYQGFRIVMTTAPAGSGKSYERTRYIVDEWLPHRDGVVITNLPLKVPEIAAFVAKRHPSMTAAEVEERIEIIPAGAMKLWKEGESGPWEYFADSPLDGAYIVIDEIHNYCGNLHLPKVRKQWQAWLGEIRHTGAAAVEFVSQSPQKIAKELQAEATQHAHLIRSDLRRDPWFKILLGDWYELRALLTREYMAGVWREEFMAHGARKVRQLAKLFRFDKEYFALYESYSKPEGGGGAAAKEPPKQEFERRSALGLVGWFVRRNAWALFSRFGCVAVVLWIMFNPSYVWGIWKSAFQSTSGLGQAPKQADAKEKPTPVDAPDAVGPDGLRSALVTKPTGGNAVGQVESDEVTQLRSELDDLRRRYQEAAAELQRTYAVVLLTPSEVQFRDGYVYKIGEVVDHGPYKGQHVVRIDWERRYAVMSSGVALRMGSPSGDDGLSVFPSPAAGEASEFRGSVPSATSTSSARRTPWLEPRAAANVVGRGDAGTGVSEVRSSSIRDFSRRRIEARRAASNNRSGQPASERRPGGGEPTPWRATDQAGGSVLPGPTPAGGSGGAGS